MAQAGRKGTVRGQSQTLNRPPDTAGPPQGQGQHPSEALCLALWDPRRDTRNLRPAGQPPGCVDSVFSCGPSSGLYPSPAPSGPLSRIPVWTGRGGTRMLRAVSPVPRGLWPHLPSPATSNSHLPASQASPCSPELYPPSCHPLGSGTPVLFPLPVTSSNSPSWTFCSGLHSFLEPHWAPGRTPQSVLPAPHNPCALWTMASVSEAQENKDSACALVWREPWGWPSTGLWSAGSEPQQPGGCPLSRQLCAPLLGAAVTSALPPILYHTCTPISLTHAHPLPAGFSHVPPKEMSAS